VTAFDPLKQAEKQTETSAVEAPQPLVKAFAVSAAAFIALIYQPKGSSVQAACLFLHVSPNKGPRCLGLLV